MQIFSGIGAELTLLRDSLLIGAGMFALYDLIRILRRIFPHGILWISFEDFVYWVVAAGWFFLYICKANNGIIRFYVILGIALGALLYYALFSRYLIKYLSLMIGAIKKQLKKFKKAATIRLEKLQRLRKKNESGKEKTPESRDGEHQPDRDRLYGGDGSADLPNQTKR